MELGNFDLAFWDLRLAHNVEPSNQEVVKKLKEVEKVLHKPPHEHDLRHDEECLPLGFDKVTKGNETRPNQNKRSKIIWNDIDGGTLMDVERSEQGIQTQDLDYVKESFEATEIMMRDKVDDREGVGEENRKIPKAAESKYHFQNKKKPGSAIAISTREYNLLVQGKTIQHYNLRSGIAMSIRVSTGNPREAQRKANKNQAEPLSPLCPKQLCEHNHHNDQAAANTSHESEDTGASGVAMESVLCDPKKGITTQAVDAQDALPVVQGYSLFDNPVKSSPTCFQSITTANRSVTRRTKIQVQKERARRKRKIICRTSACVCSNHMFECRSKIEVKNENFDHLPSGNEFLTSYKSGMKRKSIYLHIVDIPQQPKKFMIINDKSNSCFSRICMLHLQATVCMVKTSAYD